MQDMREIAEYVGKLMSEAKKKKEKAEELKHDAKPAGYSYSESFDFSAPLGAYNLYRTQGAVNWGPMTGPGTKIDDRVAGQRASLEHVLRDIVKESNSRTVWEDVSATYVRSIIKESLKEKKGGKK